MAFPRMSGSHARGALRHNGGMTVPDFVVAIPARYASTRLPGKPLSLIGGMPMVLHVARRALAAGARRATCSTMGMPPIRLSGLPGRRVEA